MLIKLTNTLNSIVRRVLGVIKDGLKMWLPFEKSEILGEDVTKGYDFTSGWGNTGNTTIIDADTFTTSANDKGIYKSYVTVGKTYRLTIAGTTASSTGIKITDTSVGTIYYENSSSGSFSDTVNFTVVGNSEIFIRNKSTGETTITTLKVEEVPQFSPDTSGNSNNATLYTGKALSFDGTGDSYYVDFGNTGVGLKTLAFWINLDSTTEKVLQVTSSQSVEVSSGTITLNGTWTGSTIYVDATSTSTIAASNWKRVVITTTSAITVNDLELGRIGSAYGDFILSDLQIFDSVWTQADVTFDYDNPQHLVTDNSASSIALSSLKGYWHLSEGAGSYAYNSAVALGSEKVDKGNFTGITQAESTTGSDWITGAEWTINGGKAHKASGTVTYLQQPLVLTANKYYKVTYRVSNYTGSNDVKFGFTTTSGSPFGVPRTANGVYTEIFTSSVATINLRFRANASFVGSISEITIKEVSVGTINGATASLQQSTIPQLGLMDWSKPTIDSDVVTLISDPNDPSKDILDNDVRLREHSLNLDGSGYAQVADDNSINPTNAITVECWIYWTDAVTDKGIVAKWISSGGQDYMLYKQLATKFAFYIGSTPLACTTALSNGWNHIAGTYDKTNIKVYLNGDSDGTQAHTSAITNTTQVLDIGRYENSVAKSYSERIDDVRIYDRALSADEIEQNYKAGLNQHKTGSSFSDDFSSDYGF